MRNLELVESVHGDVAVLTLSGRFDATAASGVKEQIRQMAVSGHRNVVLDMAAVTLLDSSGLGVLVASLRTLQGYGGRLAIGGVEQKVRVVLELVKLHKVLEVFPDRDTAVRALHTGEGAVL